MRIVDEKGRLFGRLNLIDLLVVLLVLGVGGRYAYTHLVSREPLVTREKERTIEVTTLLSAVREASIQALPVGSRLYETKSGAYLGEVVRTEAKPADIVFIGNDGRTYETTSNSRKDFFVTIRGRGRVSENTVMLGGIELRVGTTLPIKSNIYSGVSVVYAINLNP